MPLETAPEVFSFAFGGPHLGQLRLVSNRSCYGHRLGPVNNFRIDRGKMSKLVARRVFTGDGASCGEKGPTPQPLDDTFLEMNHENGKNLGDYR